MSRLSSFRPFAPQTPVYPFVDRRTRRHFHDLVRSVLGRDGRRVVIEDGVAVVDGQPGQHGLANLARLCHEAPREQWPQLVAEHLGLSDVEAITRRTGNLLDQPFAVIRRHLGVRLYQEQHLSSAMAGQFVERVDLPGTSTVVVVDIGPSMLLLPTLVAQTWPVPTAELFVAGIANLTHLTKLHRSSLLLGTKPAVALDVLSGDNFASSHVLAPEQVLPRLGAHGNLLAVPTRDVLLSLPLDDGLSLWAVEAMLVMARGRFDDGVGPISPHLFWRRPDGGFERQQGNHEPGAGRVQLAPSPAFAELLARLRPAAGGT
ncbi:MAG: hypothetical protein IPK26_08885 [Planctomycetes bacterium]|nr:hypothetical protein [Planctomycetota bacterium]